MYYINLNEYRLFFIFFKKNFLAFFFPNNNQIFHYMSCNPNMAIVLVSSLLSSPFKNF